MHGDLTSLIETAGYIGLFGIIYAETGLLFGFFLPGDSLLFTAGFLASQGLFNIAILCILLFFAAVLGDSTGYYIGHKFGKRLFRREDSIFFHKDHLIRAEKFYEKHGGKTIILARFMPIIRTFAPVVAGIGSMHYSRFITYNVVGALLWAVCLPLLGYFLGNVVPGVDRYLLPIIIFIILASIAPGLYHTLKTKEQRQEIIKAVKSLLRKKK